MRSRPKTKWRLIGLFVLLVLLWLRPSMVAAEKHEEKDFLVLAGILANGMPAGNNLAQVPMQALDPDDAMFDPRQFARWGAGEDQLPQESMVQAKQQPTLGQYKWYLLAAILLVLLESLLTVSRVVQGRKLKRSEAMLKELSRHLINAQEEERRRIARELHDDFGQRLALLRIELEILSQEKRLGPKIDEGKRLRTLLGSVDDLAKDIQHLSYTLHSSKLQYIGLEGALKDLCRQISKQHQKAVDLKALDLSNPLPDEMALCFYRVAQEALHNAAKHSGAQQVVVSVSDNDAMLYMLVADDGRGFDQAQASLGLGLASMRERLQMIGGELWVLSKPGSGTELRAEAPLQQSYRQSKVS
jgi:signal transduction histidine kinase